MSHTPARPTFVNGMVITAALMNELVSYIDFKADQAQQAAEVAQAAAAQSGEVERRMRRAIALGGIGDEA